MSNGSYLPSQDSQNDKNWYLVDAKNQSHGRLSSHLAQILMGKHKSDYGFNIDRGDHLTVINGTDIKLNSSNKLAYKFRHSGRPGGASRKSFKYLLDNTPDKLLRNSVSGMLPNGPRGRKMLRRLRVYPTDVHPHAAQNLILIKLDSE